MFRISVWCFYFCLINVYIYIIIYVKKIIGCVSSTCFPYFLAPMDFTRWSRRSAFGAPGLSFGQPMLRGSGARLGGEASWDTTWLQPNSWMVSGRNPHRKWMITVGTCGYPLVICYSFLLNMAIEIVSVPTDSMVMFHTYVYKRLPEGRVLFAFEKSALSSPSSRTLLFDSASTLDTVSPLERSKPVLP